MIISDKFIIVTPTKTATFSLESMYKGIAAVTKPRHAWVLPDPYACTTPVILPIRNPIERFVSMWQYLSREGSRWGNKYTSTIEEFYDYYVHRLKTDKKKNDWTMTYCDYIDSVSPDYIISINRMDLIVNTVAMLSGVTVAQKNNNASPMHSSQVKATISDDMKHKLSTLFQQDLTLYLNVRDVEAVK